MKRAKILASFKKSLLVGAIAAILVASPLVYAGRDKDERQTDAADLAQAKVSLTQAIVAAEQRVQGRAVRAELEDENGTIVYSVDVLNGKTTTDVKVDSTDGKILSAQAEQDEHEGTSNEQENEHEE
jgi:uncharacterized membrane protein YkoI